MYPENLNRLCKWRAILTGWQLGTRKRGDSEADAVRDHREVTLILRAELNAFTQLLIRKGVFTEHEFESQVETEAQFLQEALERKFPGAKATDSGMTLDKRAEEWMKDFPL